jgi:hypothetical protein
MYPADESFVDLASVSFLRALQDANMLQPTGLGNGLLFPPGVYNIILGGDAAMVGSNRTITVPLNPPVFITIGRPYGEECGWMIADPHDANSFGGDVNIWIPFTVWSSTDGTQDSVEKALLFARDKRQNVFSAHGLSLQVTGQTGAKPRGASPVTGLQAVDYRWKFFYSRSYSP